MIPTIIFAVNFTTFVKDFSKKSKFLIETRFLVKTMDIETVYVS
jgi:hypothetical protein